MHTHFFHLGRSNHSLSSVLQHNYFNIFKYTTKSFLPKTGSSMVLPRLDVFSHGYKKIHALGNDVI